MKPLLRVGALQLRLGGLLQIAREGHFGCYVTANVGSGWWLFHATELLVARPLGVEHCANANSVCAGWKRKWNKPYSCLSKLNCILLPALLFLVVKYLQLC